MKNISIGKKVLMYLLVAMLVTNPVTGSLVLSAIDWVFAQAFIYGGYVSVVGTAYLILYLLWANHQQSKVNIPAKSKKTKPQAYVTT